MAAGQTEAAESMFEEDQDEEIQGVDPDTVEWAVPKTPEELHALLADIGAFNAPISA